MTTFGTPNLSSVLVNDKKFKSIRHLSVQKPHDYELQGVTVDGKYTSFYSNAYNNRNIIPSGSTIEKIRIILNADENINCSIRIIFFDLSDQINPYFDKMNYMVATSIKKNINVNDISGKCDKYLRESYDENGNKVDTFSPFTVTQDLCLGILIDDATGTISSLSVIAYITPGE